MPDTHPFADRWNHNTAWYPRIADLIAGHEVVLDVGCGDGTLARYLASRGHQVLGIDIDPDVLPDDSEDTHFMLADVSALPFENDSFDAVVSVMVLHHTRINHALVEMRRVLKPGGRFVDVGYGRDRGPVELLRSALDVPGDLLAKRGKTLWEPPTVKKDPKLGWAETRDAIEWILPGTDWRRLPGWRYLASWQRPA